MAVPSSGDPRHPIPGTGPYRPPLSAVPMNEPANSIAGARQLAYLHAGSAGGFADLVDILRAMYPPKGGPALALQAPWVNPRQIGGIIANNQPVADRQTLTMNSFRPSGNPGHPLPGTGPYIPPSVVSTHAGPRGKPIEAPISFADLNANPREPAELIDILRALYPPGPGGGPDAIAHGITNSQAIGDRSVTTMTNPLPGYQPLQMTKAQMVDRLRTLITLALAQQTRPLVNTPLPVGATQMGRG